MSERIDLPRQRANEGRPINVTFRPNSFPQQEFQLKMEWNSQRGEWTIELRHLDLDRLITKSMAQPYRLYDYMPWCLFLFADPTGQKQHVTPDTLQDDVFLYVHPGPSGQPPSEW